MATETELKLAIAAHDVPALLAHPLLAAQPSVSQAPQESPMFQGTWGAPG